MVGVPRVVDPLEAELAAPGIAPQTERVAPAEEADPGRVQEGHRMPPLHVRLLDAEGLVRFTTIYPGAYPGRAVHIHFKIRSEAGGGRKHEFTSQLFFDDALTDQVHAQAPYVTPGRSRLRNAGDGIYGGAGTQLTLAVTPAAPGYAASFDLALQIA